MQEEAHRGAAQQAQQAVRRRRTEIKKIRRDRNPAGVVTKPKSLHDINVLLEPVDVVLKDVFRRRRETLPPRGGQPLRTLCGHCLFLACLIHVQHVCVCAISQCSSGVMGESTGFWLQREGAPRASLHRYMSQCLCMFQCRHVKQSIELACFVCLRACACFHASAPPGGEDIVAMTEDAVEEAP